MTIEVKQLLIKSTIVASGGTEQNGSGSSPQMLSGEDREVLKNEILAACRDMVAELLQRQKER